MIDHGFCFNAGGWSFPDAPLRGLYPDARVYRDVVGMVSFEPWLDRLEKLITEDVLLGEARLIPPEWYLGEWSEMQRLLERLYGRRARVRELIFSTARSDRNPFPNWNLTRPQVYAA
jgi:hypothetical protein